MTDRLEQEKNITQQLRIIFKAIQAHSKEIEKVCGLSSVRLWMLHAIQTSPGIKVSELAIVLSIHRSTCSNMLDKLEDMDLVYRKRSRSDQRSVHLFITDKGANILEKSPAPPEGKLSSSLHKLSPDKLGNLEQGLSDLIEVLHFDDAKAALTPIELP